MQSVIAFFAGDRDRFSELWMDEIPMATLATSIRKSGRLQFADEVAHLGRHVPWSFTLPDDNSEEVAP